MNWIRTNRVFLLCLMALLVILASLSWLDRPLWGEQSIRVESPDDETLEGSYWPGTRQAAALLLHGFGSDRTAMRTLAAEYARLGWHVLAIDFSGNGRSPGALTFDNAATDRLAGQVLAAASRLEALSGVESSDTVWVGHSLGARVALQASAMQASATQPAGFRLPAGVVLLGAQINLQTNTQAEFFTGVSDADLAWVQSLAAHNPPVGVYLVSGEWDDILTPPAARLLFEKMAESDGTGNLQTTANPVRRLELFPSLVHNYVITDGRVLTLALNWSAEAINEPPQPVLTWAGWRGWLWLLGTLALTGSALTFPTRNSLHSVESLGVVTPRRWLLAKLFLWLAAVPFAVAISSLFFFLPGWLPVDLRPGLPVINLIYVGFIGGYGILMWGLYRSGRMPGVSGKLYGATQSQLKTDWVLCLLLLALVWIGSTWLVRTGMFYAFPILQRGIWVLLFTPFTVLGFWIGLRETAAISAPAQQSWTAFWAGLIGLTPFIIYTLFLAGLGSLSGVLGNVQGLVVLALALISGENLRRSGLPLIWIALHQALLIYWLILPGGALFQV